MYVGWFGQVHDVRVFANSSLYQRGQNNRLFPDHTKQIAGQDVPLVLLGHPAYPWLMKAIPMGDSLTNEKHSTILSAKVE